MRVIFLESKILAQSDFFGSMKNAGIFLGRKKHRGIFLSCEKRNKGFFFWGGGMLKRSSDFFG